MISPVTLKLLLYSISSTNLALCNIPELYEIPLTNYELVHSIAFQFVIIAYRDSIQFVEEHLQTVKANSYKSLY